MKSQKLVGKFCSYSLISRRAGAHEYATWTLVAPELTAGLLLPCASQLILGIVMALPQASTFEHCSPQVMALFGDLRAAGASGLLWGWC